MDDAVNELAWEHELGGLPSRKSHLTVRTMQESAHCLKKKEAKGEKGASNTTVAAENGQYISPESAGQVENAEVRKPKYGNESTETKVWKWEEKPPLSV